MHSRTSLKGVSLDGLTSFLVMIARYNIALCLVFSWISLCAGSRVLLLCDPLKSRQGMFDALANELVSRGHEVFWLLNSGSKFSGTFAGPGKHAIVYLTQNPNSDLLNYDELTSLVIEHQGYTRAIMSDITDLVKTSAATILMENEAMLVELEDADIDLAVVDGSFMTDYKYLIPHRLGIPFVSLSDYFDPWNNGVPWLPSFTPFAFLPYSHEMNFMERLKNTAYFVSITLFGISPKLSPEIVQRYSQYGSFSSLGEISAKSKLWILTSDPVLDYPKPMMPNMIEAGGISTKPAKPLDVTWTDVLQKSVKGVVLVSFGSVVSNFPEEIATKLLTAFGRLEQTVIFRFNNKDKLTIPANVVISDWIPQNDLLANPNTKVFVTHCGNSGLYEAVFHGVPMIAMPVAGDGFQNAKRVVYRGYGIFVDAFNFQADDLVSAINRVAKDPSYKQRIAKASMIFRDRPETPVQRAVSGVEHILKYGGDHLLSHSSKMPLHQLLMLDILVVTLLCCVIGAFVSFRIIICVLRLCCSRRDHHKSKKE